MTQEQYWNRLWKQLVGAVRAYLNLPVKARIWFTIHAKVEGQPVAEYEVHPMSGRVQR